MTARGSFAALWRITLDLHPRPSNLFQLVTHSAKLEGFMTHLQVERYPEAPQQLLSWISQGQLK